MVSFRSASTPSVSGGGRCIATVERSDGTYSTWATTDLACASCGDQWGLLSDGIVVHGPSSGPRVKDGSIKFASLDVPGVDSFEITNQLDGKGAGFGDRFWKWIGRGDLSAAFQPCRPLLSVEYEDRYLSTPIACALLLEVVSALKSHYDSEGGWNDTPVQIKTMLIDGERLVRRPGHWWGGDWIATDIRDRAIEAAFEYSGMSARVLSAPKRDLSHGRRLILNFTDGGKYTLWLDQGWSYWAPAKHHRQTNLSTFNMALPSHDLGEALAQLRIDVQGHEVSTQVFFDRRHVG